tara:strand:- start:561 stop:1514 length:954 start_codon:yes stop_codon:yes gene_type:complete
MKILVTGGAGYVGTKLVSELLDLGHKIVVLDQCWFGNYLPKSNNLKLIKGDIRDKELVNNLDEDIEIIYHLANIANDPSGLIDSKLTWETNVLATKFLVEWAIDINISKFIYASSGSVYGVKEEEKVTEDLPLEPISDYNKTKMISERVLLSYSDKIPTYILRPATICGFSPRMRLDLTVNVLTFHALNFGVINVFGGDQIRPNINIKDMISTYTHFLFSEIEPGIYNVGFENLSVKDIAHIISEKFNVPINFSDSNDPRSYRLNSDKLLSTGFIPKFSVNDAIEEVNLMFRKDLIRDDDFNYNVKTMDILKKEGII